MSRKQKIIALLEAQKQVSVDDLVALFNVSPQTIRTDLNELHRARKLVRIHGGARLDDGRENVEYTQRRQIAALQKRLIGEAAAALIPDNASLFINIGTTTEAFSTALRDHSGLLVVTNNINVANELRVKADNEVIITGGEVRTEDGAIVGQAAVDFIKNFKVDYAVIGSSAMDETGALLDFDFREVKVAQAIIENARHVILVADSTKQKRSAPVRIGHMSQVDTFVTDTIGSAALRAVCAEAQVEVVEVQA